MFLALRVFFSALLFWFLLPSFESIYYYHFGTVTNSDALYPYLIVKDLSVSFELVKGWVTPPSHCLFPDLILMFLIQQLTSDIFQIHFIFAFFCFLSILFLLRSLGFSRSVGLVAALSFLKMGEYFPASWGQFFLPSFHGTEFFLLGFCIRLLRGHENFVFYRQATVGIVIGFSIYSELWFVVHSALPLLIFALSLKDQKPKKIFVSLISGIFTYFILLQVQKKVGIGSFQLKQFPLADSFQNTYLALTQNPGDFFGSLLFFNHHLPLGESLIPIFWVLLFLSISHAIKLKESLKYFILPAGFLLASIFTKFANIEPNARYFYFLPISCISLFFFQISNFPKLKRLVAYFSLIGLIFVSHRYWINPETQFKIEEGKAKHVERLSCVNRTLSLWGELPGASTYWPVKYLRTFSNGKIQLIPFTPEGIYYPWVHNLNWDKNVNKLETSSLSWGITTQEQGTLFGKTGIETVTCTDWKLIRISK